MGSSETLTITVEHSINPLLLDVHKFINVYEIAISVNPPTAAPVLRTPEVDNPV